jgi:hypothetical protein
MKLATDIRITIARNWVAACMKKRCARLVFCLRMTIALPQPYWALQRTPEDHQCTNS